jgi:hypothetical protein
MLESVKTTLRSVRTCDQVVYVCVTQPATPREQSRTCTCMSCADLKMVSFIQRIRAACCCC